MKLYHVETQEDYDALMIELDEKGYSWSNYQDIFDSNEWLTHESETVVNASENKKELSYSEKEFFQSRYPNEEIITYKAPKKEKILGIPNWVEWLARDNNGELWAYSGKPLKGIWGFAANGGRYEEVKEIDDTFKSIRWEDEEPTRVTDFIANTKKEVASEQSDPVNKPNHYVGIQGLEVETVLQNFIPRYTDSYEAHRIASAIEYLLRSPLKNGTEDVKKAKKNIEQVLSYRETLNE